MRPISDHMWRRGSKSRFDPTSDHPRRRAKRHSVDLTSDLGVVLDLSTVGMRIECEGKPSLKVGSVGEMKLRIPEGSLAVTGRVVWVDRKGLRTYQIGVEFVNVKRSVAAALDLLAQFGFIGEPSAAGQPAAASSRKKKRTMRASMKIPNYYRILGVGVDATSEEIQSAFRALARKYHPDVTTDPHGPERFIKISEAYDVLRNEEQRKKYDARRAG
ncbi:MAG: DnaJ domain-containing protein [Phycisphaerales bacterium]|nr:DnaJ domain-containing protein [Phycisphaerae bacterium]NNF42396.1 DnaJ domain-containing protein [Phycisphaerales bacterium]NNM25333.1 DnaJ domain-containing protein [Phycisphaerales bacterium]